MSLDDLVFNPCGVNKHGLAYTALSRIRSKEKLYLSTPLEISNFQIDSSVLEEMKRLTTIAKWKFSIPFLKPMRRSHIIIQSININSLQKHYIDYKTDHSMQTSHILCFQETRIRYAHDVDKYIDASRYKYIHNYGGHGILMLYEHHINCALFYTMNCNGSELIAASFNLGTHNAIYVITVYRAHSTNITLFVNHLHDLVHKAPLECPIIILGDFNVDISHDNTQHYENKKFFHSMNKLHHLKQQISTPTTINNSLIDHIWSDIPGIETTYGVTDAYWPDYHKPIYCAFKLPNSLPKFSRQSSSLPFT